MRNKLLLWYSGAYVLIDHLSMIIKIQPNLGAEEHTEKQELSCLRLLPDIALDSILFSIVFFTSWPSELTFTSNDCASSGKQVDSCLHALEISETA